MEDNDDSDYVPEQSEDSDDSSKPRRSFIPIVENEDSLDSNSDTNVTPNSAGRDKEEMSSSQSKNASESVIYQCSLCSFQVHKRHKLKLHFKSCLRGTCKSRSKPRLNAVTGAKFKCEYCLFETNTLTNLLSHKKSHSKLVASGLIECTHCKFTFFTVEERTKHLNEIVDVVDDKNKPLVCLKCQLQADTKWQLVVHRALDHVNPGSPFRCLKRDCSFETDQKDVLKAHLMDAHKLGEGVFHPLIDANTEGQQTSLTCSKCFYKTKNKVYLKAHYLNSHSKKSEAPYECPWTECQQYLKNKMVLKRHLMVNHGLDVKDDTVVPPDQDCDHDGPLLSCRNCDHKSRTDFQMMIHRFLFHPPKSRTLFVCPLPECDFNTVHKHNVQGHLLRVHKLGEEYFRDYGVEQSEEQVDSDVSEDTVNQDDLENLDEVSVVDYDYEDNSLSTATNKKRFNCGLCVFSTNQQRLFSNHQNRVHHKNQCDACRKTVWGKYQWFWHNYTVHNRQRGIEIYQWSLRCDLCGYEGTTKNSYKHGATHELSTVMFLTLFANVASGHVTFHYAEHEISNIGLRSKTHKGKSRRKAETEQRVAPSVIKVLTMSNEEEGTEEAITIELVDDSDAEAETLGNIGNPNKLPNHDGLLIKKSELLSCKECSFKTQDAARLSFHEMQVHDSRKAGQTKQYRCPEDDCPFQSKYMPSLTRHLKKIHEFNRSSWRKETPSTRWTMKRKVKRKEGDHGVRDEKHATQTNPNLHRDTKQNSQNPELNCPLDTDKKHSPLKWRLKCSHCSFETSLKKAAHRHGAQHYQVPIVTFHKYANNQRRGVLRYRYSSRDPYASTRRHKVGPKPLDSFKHNTRHNVENIGRLRARKAKKHEGTRLVRNKIVARCATGRGGSAENMTMKDNKSSKKKNRISVRKEKENFVDADMHSDGDEEGTGLEDRSDIETNTIDLDWICALENDILGDDNEVIRIEVTEDADENTEPVVEEVTETKAATLRIKCKNEGCDYVCHDTDDIQKHAESCIKASNRRGQSPEEFFCALCETTLPDKEKLQNHILFAHLVGQKPKRNRKRKLTVQRPRSFKEIPGRVSFKCGMCGMSIVQNASLRSHTHVHARVENNFDLKVKFSKYKGDTRVDTIVMKADPAYVPRTNSNVPMYGDRTVRSPELDYDPELPVFACAECNFKTNKEPELTRHKSLHWSEEKAAAFDSRKWFTCGVCYYHCLDAATFKEHADKHKSRADMKIDVKKMGKDSWIF